jgi:tetratricopeptide (TPR) repeat protein
MTTAVGLASREQARAWCEAEQEVLPAIVAQATSSGFDTHAWQIPWVLTAYFNRQGYLHEWVATLDTALAASRRAEDRLGQALASHELGYAYLRLGNYDNARVHLLHALDLNRELGNREEQAHNHVELAELEQHRGRPDVALSHARQSFDLYLAVGHRAGQARARTREGRCLTLLGEYPEALTCSLAALAVLAGLVEKEDKYATAETLKALGGTHHCLGNYPEAVDYHRQALELDQQLGDHYAEAETLERLGDAHEAAAEPDAAQDAWRQAAAILNDLHHPDVALILAKLSKLPPQ